MSVFYGPVQTESSRSFFIYPFFTKVLQRNFAVEQLFDDLKEPTAGLTLHLAYFFDFIKNSILHLHSLNQSLHCAEGGGRTHCKDIRREKGMQGKNS